MREYWQYDPTRDYLEPPLQGLELSAGEYRGLPGRELADGTLAAAETRLAQEAAARAAAEARVAELEALLRRERGSDSGQ